jgi:uncharacterized membrane protein
MASEQAESKVKRAKRKPAGSRTAVSGSNGNYPVRDAPRHYSETDPSEKDPITNFLGWFSIGLGLAEVFAPRQVARLVGLDEDEHTALLRTYGVRELVAGVGILTRPKPTYWMWNRVLGDAVDLTTIAKWMQSEENDRGRLAVAGLAVLGVTALDIASSVRLTSEDNPATGHDEGSFMVPEAADGMQQLKAGVTVNKPIEEVYKFWKNPLNYSRFMDQIESVQLTSGGRATWKAKAPAGLSVEWDAEIVTDRPNELISWQSVDGSEVRNLGTVRFRRAAGTRGTEVELEMEFHPPAGVVGEKVVKMLEAIPKTQLKNDLRRFKQLMELGEIVLSDATAVKGMQPAQPPERERIGATTKTRTTELEARP